MAGANIGDFHDTITGVTGGPRGGRCRRPSLKRRDGCCQRNCTKPADDVIFVARATGFWSKPSILNLAGDKSETDSLICIPLKF